MFNIFIKERYLSEARVDRLFWFKKVPGVSYKDIFKYFVIYQHPYRSVDKDAQPVPIVLYEEVGDYIGIPREWALEKIANYDSGLFKDNTTLGDSIYRENFVFEGNLYPEQKNACERVLRAFNLRYGTILSAPTGSGKTVMGIYIITKLACKTLIVVHKEFLKEQWIKRFQKFAPKLRVGIIQRDVDETAGSDVVIAMMQTLVSKRYSIRDAFGLVIFDEVHHVSAPVFSQVAKMFSARYRLGLSATPRRKDGTDEVFLWHIGPIVKFEDIAVLKPFIYKVSLDTYLPPLEFLQNEDVPLEVVLKFLVNNRARNETIVDILIQALDRNRKVLVLSHRRKHIAKLYELLIRKLNALGISKKVSFAIGGVSEEEIEKAREADVVFGTYQYVQEGFDIPELDTLILATPVSDPTQAIGRILRVVPGKKTPVVVDIVDNTSLKLQQLYNRRLSYYQANGWNIPLKEEVDRINSEIINQYVNQLK